MNVLVESSLLVEGQTLLAARRLPEAVECFQKAESLGAEADRCAAGRWMAYMFSGTFESAWQESDSIRERGVHDPNRFWNGEPLAGKRVILRCLHGFGDATQFLRYVPQLRSLASSLIVEVPPRFLELARCFDGVDEVVTWGASAPEHPPQWDAQIEVMELPYIFRTQVDQLPISTKYLHVPTSPHLHPTHHDRMRVGLAWNAGSWNSARSISLEVLSPIIAMQGCEIWSLDDEFGNAQQSNPPASLMNEDPACRQSIAGLAATISQLDLVITVDTLAAHLAGALGVNAWVMLPYEADWRWMHDRSDSPWYPSLTLFRQSAPGDWSSVIAAVSDALRVQANSHADGALHR